MKKIWVGFGILLVASLTVYGVVSSVSASSAPSSITAQNSVSDGECPFSKQTAAADSACCSKEAAKQTASADSACCSKEAVKQTASADSACCSKEAAKQTASADTACCSKEASQQTASADASCCGKTDCAEKGTTQTALAQE